MNIITDCIQSLCHGPQQVQLDGFHGDYDLREMNLPEACFPQRGKLNRGRHSYTIQSRSGAHIEVLLRSRAFFIKGLCEGAGEHNKLGQVSWKENVVEAWSVAKARAGYR